MRYTTKKTMAKELTLSEQRELISNPAYALIKTFETQQRMAQMYSTSTIVPDTYKNNIGNCVIAIDMAHRMQASPLMVMQNLYIVHGNPSWASKFLISCVNSCGRFSPLRYEFDGSDKCRAYAYERSDKEHKEPLYGDWITMEMANKEGWTKKAGSKWATMPGQMLRYRAAAFWQRVYAPEISMGFLTKEEMEDGAVIDDEQDVIEMPVEEVQDSPQQTADIIESAMQKQKVDTATGELFN